MSPKTDKKGASESARSNADELVRALSAVTARAAIAARMGKSFGTDRDLYEALGYDKNPVYADYMGRYTRQDIARAVVDAPVRACWRMLPRVTESQDDETEFEEKWLATVDRVRVYHHLTRVDRLAGIGNYAVLFLGFDDGKELSEPVTSAGELLYLMPYSQTNATVATWVVDVNEARYGLPETYTVTMKKGASTTLSQVVHHSRIVHVAEDLLEDNVEGLPRLQAVFNRLEDLERVVGGSAEMFWRGAFPGYGFKADEGFTLGAQAMTELQDEIEEYMHGLKRYIRLRGISVEDLAMQVADPSDHADVIITLIACAVRIPKRILLGSERGELASSMDERNWIETIDARRVNYCEPVILRAVVDRLVLAGALPAPGDRYVVEWPDLTAPGDKEVADVGAVRSKALKDYVDGIGADAIVPPEVFLRKVLGFSDEDVEKIEGILADVAGDEDADGADTDDENGDGDDDD